MRLINDQPYRGRALVLPSPVGQLALVENGRALTHLLFDPGDIPSGAELGRSALLDEAEKQLSEYFDGLRRDFEIPLAPFGTDFQLQVWRALRQIPYGQTSTYGEIAQAVGRPEACRAVGQANNRNPLGIIIPCHRVVGRDGGLTGYAGGLAAKDFLLRLESDVACGRLRSCPAD